MKLDHILKFRTVFLIFDSRKESIKRQLEKKNIMVRDMFLKII